MAPRKAIQTTSPQQPNSPSHRQMDFDFNGLLQILANSLYSERKVFIRELLQNGHDSVQRRRKRDPQHHGRLEIVTRPEELWISFRDDGIGMNFDDLTGYLSRIGSSGTRELGRTQEEVAGLVGQFGIGFLSGFIVADRVEVRTRKLDEPSGWLWQCSGGKDYSVEACQVESVGTTVKVFLKDPADRAIIEQDAVAQVIREYCDMLRVPIHLNSGNVPVNTQVMPWERDGLSEEERDLDCRIYLAKTIRGDSLIETFPVRLDHPFRAGGILYISKMRTFGVRVPRNVRIYQDRMYVANDAELLPPWAEFVSGIIETTGLTPNAARDGFIKNAAWSQLREALGEIVIRGMDRLRETNRDQLSYILKYHDLGIKAACHHHEPFFKKFAHLLEWRVNRLPSGKQDDDARDALELDPRSIGISFHWRTLPEVLAVAKSEPGRPKRLLAFTTSNAANQYFDMANAEGVQVVDASYPFEDELIAAYAKLPDVPPIDLVYVDRQGGGLFRELEADDHAVRRLAEEMTRIIHPGGVGKLKVEARRFQPTTLPAVLLNAERSASEQQARQILSDPSQPGHLREMAEELLRNARLVNAMRMTINASCPFIQELARHNLRDQDIQHVMLGVYNSAILYNAEMLTPRNARVFHDQFGDFMESTLKMIHERAKIQQERLEIEQERAAYRRSTDTEPSQSGHRILFLMTPFNESYAALEQALRIVVEDRWRCQLCLARDRVLKPELRENVEAHMQQAHAFIAEVSTGNPNVMYEVGRARGLYPGRPMIFLSHPREDSGKVELPADLSGLLRIDYRREADISTVADLLEKELRKFEVITKLLEDSAMAAYVPVSKLQEFLRKYQVPSVMFQALSAKFSTVSLWQRATAEQIHDIVKDHGFDREDAAIMLKRIQQGINT